MSQNTAQEITNTVIEYLKVNDLYSELPAVNKLLNDELYRNHDVTIISAEPLAKPELDSISKLVTEKWGEHKIITTVDDALVNGIIVKFMDQIIDMSARDSLKQLETQLKG